MSKDNGHFFPNLEGAAIGRPITRAGISFFPVYLMDNGLPEITTGPTADRVIDELNDASVPDLTVTNPGEFPLLLIEGEQFIGGKQNRTVNISVLVAAGATLEIPVSCLEAGRWGRQRDFQPAATNTPRRVRRTIHDAVAAQAGTASARRGAQGEVWAGIDASLHEMRMSSPTAAIADADKVFTRDRDRGAPAEELARLGPLPGQCGFVVTHGPRIVGTEIFGDPELLRPHWPALVRSYLLEEPSATGRPSSDRVLRALRSIGGANCKRSPGLGLGEERHFTNEKGTGQALTLQGSLVRGSVLSR